MAGPPCRACDNAEGNRPFSTREMMYGLRDTFEYFECAGCGSLQIVTPPADLGKYYPGDYYSYSDSETGSGPRLPFRGFLKRQRARSILGDRNLIGNTLVRLFGSPSLFDWLKRLEVTVDDAILDVGCGAGHLLHRLREAGFSRLTGVDAFIGEDRMYTNGVRVLRRDITEIREQFDCVMFHHSFEHFPNPRNVLHHVRRILKPGRRLLVRTPVAGCYAWRTYGPDWVSLDPPRHLFVPSERGMRHLAAVTKFEIVAVEYDSYSMQFWASEQYRRNIPLRDPRSYDTDPSRSDFTPEQLLSYERESDRLNSERDGDQAAFYLKAV